MGQLVGPLVEFLVSKLATGEGDGSFVGSPGDLGFKEGSQSRFPWVVCSGVIPGGDKLLFPRRDQRERGQRTIRSDDYALQEILKVGGHAGDSAGIEQVGVVFKHGVQSIAHLRNEQGQIELGRLCV